MFGGVEPRVGDHLPNSQDHCAVRAAAVAHVGRLLSDRPRPMEVRQYTRAHGNRADVQRQRLQRSVMVHITYIGVQWSHGVFTYLTRVA